MTRMSSSPRRMSSTQKLPNRMSTAKRKPPRKITLTTSRKSKVKDQPRDRNPITNRKAIVRSKLAGKVNKKPNKTNRSKPLISKSVKRLTSLPSR